MKKRLFLTVTIVFVLLFSMCLCASAATKLTVDGQVKDVVAYNIKGNNYFKLRDIANLLNGTNAQFDVTWDDQKKAINLKSNTAYSTNDSISLDEIKNPVAQGSTSAIYKDGGKILAGAYNISGNNYFKLRDIAAIFDFAVVWNDSTKTIGIDTTKHYEYPVASSEFSINPEIISYIGKTKAQMDALFGEPTPIMEDVYSFSGITKGLGGDIYANGVKVSYNARDELKIVTKVEAPMSMMFYNCPATIDRAILDKAFYETNIGKEWDFQANVYGGTLEVYLKDGNITSSGKAILSYSTYPSEMTEIVYVGKEWANTATKNHARLYKEYFEKEFTTGKFSKETDPYPFFDYYDFNKDGIAEVVGYFYAGGFLRNCDKDFYEIFTIIDGKVVSIYTMGEKENICFYSQPGQADYDLKIARRIDDETIQFYTLDIKTGKLTYYSKIRLVYNHENAQQTKIWLNGKQLVYDSDEFNAAFLNHSFNYPFNLGNNHYSDLTMQDLTINK